MRHGTPHVSISLVLSLLLAGCYAVRPSSGGGQTTFTPPRSIQAADVAVPKGYRIAPVTQGLSFPTAAIVDDDNQLYVIEAGYSYGEVFTTPRLLRVAADGVTTVIATGTNPPWTGGSYHDGAFYIAEGGDPGRIVRVTHAGNVETVVDGLPGAADHFTNRPVMGRDGWLYFGQGTATNSGVVGADNARMGWLKRAPRRHDIPCRDVTLRGVNYTTPNVLNADAKQAVRTGAYVPFGTPTQSGEVIKGQVPCTGALMRVRPQGGRPELVAWGLRHPFGIAFAPDGQLYVTDNGYDDRGSRPVFGTGDFLWAIKPGAWYGWPDYAGDQPLTDRRFKVQGKSQPEFLLAQHPAKPPRPVAVFGVHASANGLDFSRNAAFGHVGHAFVALFGDMARETGKVLHPVGFSVVRVDPQTGVIEEFIANKGKKQGPASRLGNGGVERPIDVRFDRDGTTMYIVDFGVMTVGPQGPQPHAQTGVVWRVTRAQ